MNFLILVYGYCLMWVLLALGARAGLRLRERDEVEADRKAAEEPSAR